MAMGAIDSMSIRRSMKQEIAKAATASGDPLYSFLQVQAKQKPPPVGGLTDDMLQLSLQFAFVCAFTIVWPPLPFVALVTNSLVYRLLGYRHTHAMQRPFPEGSEGIRSWND